ncbi:MAG: L-aspartate oxidase [Oscillospiraceae bacterium]|nr:L-aspartate oxidase [Oscillospiraceae bacterium]
MTVEHHETDVLIIGCGLAGLYAALHIDPRLRVLFVTKENADTSISWLAQGGIAAAVGAGDDPELHLRDTLEAGAGLCDEAAVRVLVSEAPREIEILRRMAVPFDLAPDGTLSVTREGGHRHSRVVHAGGDATGRETVKTLAAAAGERDNIRFWERSFFAGLLRDAERVTGAYVWSGGVPCAVSARCVILCAGGAGRIYSRTTNPAVATGDGVAAARRAGAELKNMEFVQFHPTGLYEERMPSGRAFLISEALRGEGALLLNAAGERFMAGRHELAELAPRDVVSRAIAREMTRSGHPCVYLDVTAKGKAFLQRRFPTIYAECAARGLYIERDRIPVAPVQHYMVGGVATGLYAETSLPGLYAVGENACTGVHGANRLASNSMLECLVFGRRCAAHIGGGAAPRGKAEIAALPGWQGGGDDTEGERAAIRAVCDRDAGIIRTLRGLERGATEMRGILDALQARQTHGRDSLETLNMASAALCVLESAAGRPESAGTHYVTGA